MQRYTPADVPDLPAGWEIELHERKDCTNLSLWRVRALLKPYKETCEENDGLIYSYSRYSDAYLPVGYTEEDLDEAIQELVWKAYQLDDLVEEIETKYGLNDQIQHPRPSRSEFYGKLF